MPAPPSPAAVANGPLVVSGFLSETFGIGKGARLTCEQLRRLGLPIQAHDIRPMLEDGDDQLETLFAEAPGGVWITHCNPLEAEAMMLRMPSRLWRERILIGYWAWELPKLPRKWAEMARLYHEIWTPSRFVAEAVAPHARSVRVMPHPVRTDPHADAGVPRDQKSVRFAAVADARSTFARKNPAGVVEAFKRAFPQPSDRARLTLKLLRPEADPAGMQELLSQISGRPDIDLIVRRLSDVEMNDFLNDVDAVVSLHRSEGFGLVLAEAMSLGKPVVATAWSGNLDFMQGHLAEGLVPCTLEPTCDPTGRYTGGVWAEPDLDAAAKIIRRLADEPLARRRLGAAGLRASAQFAWRREQLGDLLLSAVQTERAAEWA
jgi:glycosyltransferase involved in cell wall biosynthesis